MYVAWFQLNYKGYQLWHGGNNQTIILMIWSCTFWEYNCDCLWRFKYHGEAFNHCCIAVCYCCVTQSISTVIQVLKRGAK